MSEIDSNKIRKQIVDKTLFIFQTAFDNSNVSRLEEARNDENQLEGADFFKSFNQEESSEAIYTLYIEELLSQGKLGEFVRKVCEARQSNQAVQNAKEELVSLFEDLDRAECKHRELTSPPVSARHATEDVHDTFQENRTSSSDHGERETSSHSNETEPQFTFNRCIETLKQFIRTLTDEAEQPRFTPKQFVGFVTAILGAMLLAIGFGTNKRR